MPAVSSAGPPVHPRSGRCCCASDFRNTRACKPKRSARTPTKLPRCRGLTRQAGAAVRGAAHSSMRGRRTQPNKRTAPISRYDAGAAAKMSERQVKTAVRVANVPAKAFEFAVESDAPPTWSVTLTPGLRCGARGVA
jgi:hypothetical protein